MTRRESVLFYGLTVFVPLAASVYLYFNLQDQNKILNFVAYALTFVVAHQIQVLFEFWKAHGSRADDEAFQTKLKTCDRDTQDLIKGLLTTFSNGFIDKMPSEAIREVVTTEITDLIRQVNNWKESCIETTPSTWFSLDTQLLKFAHETIEATSFGQLDFWNTEKGQIYLENNIQSSAPTKRRVFILTEQEEKDTEKMKALEKTLRRHTEGNIETKIRITGPHEDLDDFAIYDRRVISYTEGQRKTKVYWAEGGSKINEYTKKFDELFKKSEPVEKWLLRLRNETAQPREYTQTGPRPRPDGGRGRNSR